jgi:hypothetical protein
MSGISSAVVGPGSAAANGSNLCVGALVAEAMSKSSLAEQKQQESQKDINQQLMEQNIASAIQQIEQHASDHATALAQIQSFLNVMNADDANWGSDIKSWITGELNTANSYSAPSNLLNTLNTDIQSVQGDINNLQSDQGSLNNCESAQSTLQTELTSLENEFKNGSNGIFKEAGIALAIVGVGIALGAVDIAVFFAQQSVKGAQDNITSDQKKVQKDKAKLNSDPGLADNLALLASGNNMMSSEAGQQVANYHSNVNTFQAFEKSVEAIIEELSSAASASSKA